MTNTHLGASAVTGVFAYSLDNNPNEEHFLKDLIKNPDYYRIPNHIETFGPSILVDHIDSITHATKMLGGGSIGFVLQLDQRFYLTVTDELLGKLTS